MSAWRKWKEVDGVPIYVWTGPPMHDVLGSTVRGLPTVADLVGAPMFTIFPAPEEVPGELYLVGELIQPDDEPLWLIALINPSYDEDVEGIMDKAQIYPPGSDAVPQFQPEISDLLKDEPIPFRGLGQHLFSDDIDVTPYVIEAGYTLIKVPDRLSPGLHGQPYRFHVLDEEKQSESDKTGSLIWFVQTPLRKQLLGGAPTMVSVAKVDIDVINRHRRGLGMGDLDPAGGWTGHELAEMAERIRKTGRMNNPRHDALKARLMR